MNFNLTVFRKSPATILIALAVVLLFLLAFWFGIAMVPEEKWGQDSNSAIGFAWANMGGLYFGILSPILVAAMSATLMGPEQKRGNINWIKSQPKGRKKLLIEKISILFSLALVVLLQSWAESSEDSVSHFLMAAACRRSQAVSKTRLTITASGFGCP